MDAYPEINTIPLKVAQMQKAGYIPVATFVLPETCWTDHFYVPQVAAAEIFLQKHRGNQMAEELVANERREAEIYARYKDYLRVRLLYREENINKIHDSTSPAGTPT